MALAAWLALALADVAGPGGLAALALADGAGPGGSWRWPPGWRWPWLMSLALAGWRRWRWRLMSLALAGWRRWPPGWPRRTWPRGSPGPGVAARVACAGV
jgi:hypothetical protein